MRLYSMGGHEFADGTERTGIFVVCEIHEFRGIGAMLGEPVEIVPSGEVARLRAELAAVIDGMTKMNALHNDAVAELASLQKPQTTPVPDEAP